MRDPFNPDARPLPRAESIRSSDRPHAAPPRPPRLVRDRITGETVMLDGPRVVTLATLPDRAKCAAHPSVARRMAEVTACRDKARRADDMRAARYDRDDAAHSARLGNSPPAVRWSPAVRSAMAARFGRPERE